jgi:hypothetical protein
MHQYALLSPYCRFVRRINAVETGLARARIRITAHTIQIVMASI